MKGMHCIMNYKILFSVIILLIISCSSIVTSTVSPLYNLKNMNTNQNKMTVEIWSDVMCPFCYIGKTKFEKALDNFPDKNNIQVTWKSFQLAPDLKTDTTISIHQFLALKKGMTEAQAKKMNQQVSEMGEAEGLIFNLDKAVVANSMNAHRLLHFTKEHGKQNEAEDLLFKAYFTEGKNIDDISTLRDIAVQLSLNPEALSSSLVNGIYINEVKADIDEAQKLGLRGVPFFIFNRKHVISGAQEEKVFLSTLEKSFREWKNEKSD